MTADGLGTIGIMRWIDKSKPSVWRWQEGFTQAGVEGHLRDKIRPSRIPALARSVMDQVIEQIRAGRVKPVCSI